jgi:putative ABC transport system permease protein
MFKNHWQLALRNLAKRKGYSALNILGLTIGITCCLLIFQYVAFEKSYDGFHSNAGQIVRLRVNAWQKGKLAYTSATVYPAIRPTMKKDFPEVENFCRLIDANFLLSNDRDHVRFQELKGYYADPSALEMLGVDFAYHVSMRLSIFALAGFLAILIALLSISSQSIRAAVSNPVKSLRTE